VTPTPELPAVPRLETSGAIRPLPNMPSWRVQRQLYPVVSRESRIKINMRWGFRCLSRLRVLCSQRSGTRKSVLPQRLERVDFGRRRQVPRSLEQVWLQEREGCGCPVVTPCSLVDGYQRSEERALVCTVLGNRAEKGPSALGITRAVNLTCF
jgi:hypothetical protein